MRSIYPSFSPTTTRSLLIWARVLTPALVLIDLIKEKSCVTSYTCTYEFQVPTKISFEDK